MIMRCRRGSLALILAIALLSAACGGGSTGPGIGCVVVTVSISPSGSLTLEVGESRTLTATVQDNGGCSPRPEPEWSGATDAVTLSATRGASITVEGAVAGGAASLTATAGGRASAPLAISVVIPAPAQLEVVAGNNQTAEVGTAVATPPAVRARSARGDPIPGIRVGFKVTAGGGQLEAQGGGPRADSITVTTGADGVARVGAWILGTGVGQHQVRASVAGPAPAALLSANASAGPPDDITIVDGADQRAYAGEPVSVPPAVRLVDRFGNPVPGATVTFAVTQGGGQLTGATPVTDAGGVARVTAWVLGAVGVNRLSVFAPRQVNIFAEAIRVTTLGAGDQHSCAGIEPSGLFCWGANGSGQAGDASGQDRTRPGEVLGSRPRLWSLIDGGADFTCALESSPLTVWCWGGNGQGQLGQGDTQPRIGIGTGIGHSGITLAAGTIHACLISADQVRFCSGANDEGQLGDGTTQQRLSLAKGEDLESYRRLAAGKAHTCAIGQSFSAWCWGANDLGQLGDGTQVNRLTPVTVGPPGSLFFEVAAGDAHTCAINGGAGAVSGPVLCWGRGSSGQLGDGLAQNSTTPQTVSGGFTFKAIAAGGDHACAIRVDGVAMCWGANSRGQLGTGTLINEEKPIAVGGNLRFDRLAAGAGHTCGLATDGRVYCWGANGRGQLGLGDLADRTTPTLVRF